MIVNEMFLLLSEPEAGLMGIFVISTYSMPLGKSRTVFHEVTVMIAYNAVFPKFDHLPSFEKITLDTFSG